MRCIPPSVSPRPHAVAKDRLATSPVNGGGKYWSVLDLFPPPLAGEVPKERSD